jgi:hypothetical protein
MGRNRKDERVREMLKRDERENVCHAEQEP